MLPVGPAYENPEISLTMSQPDAQPRPADTDPSHNGTKGGHRSLYALALGSVGVVYGDIGTSPLYAFRETLHVVAPGGFGLRGLGDHFAAGLDADGDRHRQICPVPADGRQQGRGGRSGAVCPRAKGVRRRTWYLLALGIAGAAFFFGDAILTPAISVLSAVEGIALVAPSFEPLVIPVTLGVLVFLFMVQRGGTGAISAWFGPITAVWFLTMAGLGLYWIFQRPEVLVSLSPLPGLRFLFHHTNVALFVLSGVFLAVTGAEALYADLGHLAKTRSGWPGLVWSSRHWC